MYTPEPQGNIRNTCDLMCFAWVRDVPLFNVWDQKSTAYNNKDKTIWIEQCIWYSIPIGGHTIPPSYFSVKSEEPRNQTVISFF
jgi:hypothetical protein